MADSSPLMTLLGKKAPSAPACRSPSPIWRKPASTTATRKPSKEPRFAICAATMAVSPAAGPLTLVWEPLVQEMTSPPTIPAISPESRGASEARAMPRQRGRATRKTTTPLARSRGSAFR